MAQKQRGWEFWVAICAMLLSLLGGGALLYARFYNVEWRLTKVETKLDKVLEHFSIIGSKTDKDGE